MSKEATISVRIPDDLYARLHVAAREAGMTASEYVRRIITPDAQ